MILSSGKAARTQYFVSSLYSAASEDELLDRIIPQLADIIPSDYSDLVFLPPTAAWKPRFLMQDPSVFIQYDNADMSPGDIVLDRNGVNSGMCGGNWFIKGCRKVISTAQRWQFPVIVRSRMAGVFIIARTGSNPVPYTDDELKLAAFLISFIADGLERVFMPFPGDDWTGFLEADGNLISSGECIYDFFSLFFGERFRDSPQRNPGINGKAYRKCLEGFYGGKTVHGSAELFLTSGFAARRFTLRLLPPSRLQPFFPEVARFVIRLLHEPGFLNNDGLDAAAEFFALTQREMQIIRLLSRGCSNRVISAELGIAIPTVKHHLYNIFNKTGADSRTHLIMLLDGTGA